MSCVRNTKKGRKIRPLNSNIISVTGHGRAQATLRSDSSDSMNIWGRVCSFFFFFFFFSIFTKASVPR